MFPREMARPTAPTIRFDQTIQLEADINDKERAIAWFVPAPQIRANKNATTSSNDRAIAAAPVVIFCHGNAEIIDYQDEIVHRYHQLGVSVLLPEFRGYGRSGGTPTQEGIRKDLINFYDQIAKRADVDKDRIFFHGRSLGAAVAADLARHRKPAALITQSTFSSAVAMAYRYLAPAFLVKHPYRTDHVVADTKIDFPLLIFHGTNDSIIPVGHSRKLRDIAQKAQRDITYKEYPCDHNDFPGPAVNDYWQQIESFLRDRDVIGS